MSAVDPSDPPPRRVLSWTHPTCLVCDHCVAQYEFCWTLLGMSPIARRVPSESFMMDTDGRLADIPQQHNRVSLYYRSSSFPLAAVASSLVSSVSHSLARSTVPSTTNDVKSPLHHDTPPKVMHNLEIRSMRRVQCQVRAVQHPADFVGGHVASCGVANRGEAAMVCVVVWYDRSGQHGMKATTTGTE